MKISKKENYYVFVTDIKGNSTVFNNVAVLQTENLEHNYKMLQLNDLKASFGVRDQDDLQYFFVSNQKIVQKFFDFCQEPRK